MTDEKNSVTEPCPGHFQWSAFGARYMDTACASALDWSKAGYPEGQEPAAELCDGDDDFRPKGIPCPFCDPPGYTEYQFGGGYVVPLCAVGEHRVPDGTAIHYHDGYALTWTIACPEHGECTGLMRDMSEQADFVEEEFVPWNVEVAKGTR